MDKKIVILGAGITGISTAYHLSRSGINDYTILEKEEKIGGLCRTESIAFKKEKFLFDYTGHLLHLNSDYVKRLLGKFLKKHFVPHFRKAFIYLDQKYIPYPFQANLKNLEFKAMEECMLGAVESWGKYSKSNDIRSFYDWINKKLGIGIAKHFMVPYNSKVFLTNPANMTCDWLGKFIPDIDLKDIFENICMDENKAYGYNTRFFYPKNGGIEKIFDFFLPGVSNIKCIAEVRKIDINKKIIYLKNKEKIKYDIAVSTIPLDELCRLICPIPGKILKEAKKLKSVSVLNINFGIQGKLPFPWHWIYFPEKKYIFYRIGFPSNVSSKSAPYGLSSISAEISYKGRIDNKKAVDKTINDLIRLKIIKNRSSIVKIKTMSIKHGYVIFDKNREKILKDILGFLNKRKLHSIGRYGNWEYSYIEENILSGKAVAEELVASARGGSAFGRKS